MHPRTGKELQPIDLIAAYPIRDISACGRIQPLLQLG